MKTRIMNRLRSFILVVYGFLIWLPPVVLLAGDQSPQLELAKHLVTLAGRKQGLCAMPRCGDGQLALAMSQNSGILVHAMDARAENVKAIRQAIDNAGLLGRRIYVEQGIISAIPLADNYVDLLLVTDLTDGNLDEIAPSEIMRVLSASRGVAILGHADAGNDLSKTTLETWLKKFNLPDAKIVQDAQGLWVIIQKPRLEGVDDWSHCLHGSDNNPVSQDAALKGPYLGAYCLLEALTGNPVQDAKGRPLYVSPAWGVCDQATTLKSLYVNGEGHWYDTGTIHSNLNRVSRPVVKPPCATGMIAADGLLLASPNSCTCDRQIRGFVAFCSAKDFEFNRQADPQKRLERGTGFLEPASEMPADEKDWPVDHGNAQSSGAAAVSAPAKAAIKWQYKPAHPFENETWPDTEAFEVEHKPTAAICVKDMIFYAGTDGVKRLECWDMKKTVEFLGTKRQELSGQKTSWTEYAPFARLVQLQSNEEVFARGGRKIPDFPMRQWSFSMQMNAVVLTANAVVVTGGIRPTRPAKPFEILPFTTWELVALDRKTGAELWREELPSEPLSGGISVTRDGNLIVMLRNGGAMCVGEKK